MKKTISITIAGVIFNIEEDAFLKLSAYLDTVKKYFSTYEGADEITADIEGRIAEKFTKNLKENGKVALEMDDVDKLMTSMGTVADFEAVEEDEDLKNEQTAPPVAATKPINTSTTESKFYRNAARKAIGGVCSGIGHTWNIDTIWIRIATILLVISPAIFDTDTSQFSFVIILGYAALWFAFPEKNLEENVGVKKYYRDIENKAIFGVAAGLATYLGIDRGLMRIIFFITAFMGGIGILAYFILWAVSPTADTLTQKMEMKGQPVTISNIEQNVKTNNFASGITKPEPLITKVALLPFRIMGGVFSIFGSILKGIGPVLRIFVGFTLFFVFGIILMALIACFAVMLGFGNIPNSYLFDVPVSFFTGDVSPLLLLFSFVAIGLPFFMLTTIGLGFIANRKFLSGETWGILLGTWGASLGVSAALVGTYANNFSKPGNVQETKIFNSVPKNVFFDVNNKDLDDSFKNRVRIEIEGSTEADIKVLIDKMAKGKSVKEAEGNASLILYRIEQKDSSIVFDEEISFNDKAKFRVQRANIKVFVPFNKPFRMSERFADALSDSQGWKLTDKYGINRDDENKSEWTKTIWTIKPDSGIVAVNRKIDLNAHESRNQSDDNDNIGDENDLIQQLESVNTGEFIKKSIDNFSSIDIAGNFLISIEESSKQSLELGGRDIENIQVKIENGKLKIYQKKSDAPRGKILITMPKLSAFQASGNVFTKAKGFKTGKTAIDLSGNAAMKFNGEIEQLNLNLSGESKAYLWGKAENLTIEMSGNCEAESIHFPVLNADINTSGNSEAKVLVKNKLKAATSGNSQIRYQKSENLKLDVNGSVNEEN